MMLPARKLTSENYRYGFNGKENDDDVKGAGNQQDYGMRIYDNRLGRFLSVDPLTKDFPWNTPYAFAENRVVDGIDLEGAEWANKTAFTDNSNEIKVIDSYKITLTVRNNSSLSEDEAKSRLIVLKGLTESMFRREYKGKLPNADKNFSYSFDLEITYLYDKDSKGDFVLELTDYIPPTKAGEGIVWGRTRELRNKIQLVVKDKIEFDETFASSGFTFDNTLSNQAKTFLEELGHSASLGHTGTRGILGFKADETNKQILKEAQKDNVMIQGSNFGTESRLTFSQYKKMQNQIKEDNN